MSFVLYMREMTKSIPASVPSTVARMIQLYEEKHPSQMGSCLVKAGSRL